MRRRAILALVLVGCTAPKPNLEPDRDGGPTRDAGPTLDGGPACEAPRLDCDTEDGCEVDGATDRAHCGECDNACGAVEVCVEGSCEAVAVEELALGTSHSCARYASGRVVCWGRDHRGQLGDGSYDEEGSEDRATPASVHGLADATDLDARDLTGCAVRPPGVAACWGQNQPSRFGDPIDPATVYVRAEPAVLLADEVTVVQVSLSGSHLCVRDASGGVHCSGTNHVGQLGWETDRSTALGAVSLPGAAVDLWAGGPSSAPFTLAVLADGSVYCWGSNTDGVCGVEGPLMLAVPTRIDALSDVVRVTAGNDFACAIDTAGAVLCWGDNEDGQLGREGAASIVPTAVPGVPPMRAIYASFAQAVAVTRDGEALWGWGQNERIQLGTETPMERQPPTLLVDEPGATLIAAVGSQHVCVRVRRDGVIDEVRCGGLNTYGQLGVEGGASLPLAPLPNVP